MKHFALLLSSACLLVAPTLPAQASLVAATPAVDNMHCLTLLLTDPEAHAAECGGPFTMDKGTTPLVKGSYGESCQQTATVTLPALGEDWLADASNVSRVHVAEPILCCNLSYLTPQVFDLSIGEAIRVAESCPH
ncbi:MAG TPA: hypothetical protein VG757_08625 [Devosia sp.]|nr:hypothetical protein [Devosia sp.]